jgi:hypothetical protein
VPRVTLLPNGVTASCPRWGSLAETRKRGRIRGWSPQAAGRLRRWFYAVDGEALDGHGLAMTLSIRDLPPSAADWARTRNAFIERMRRAGAVRLQWLTEWQRRGVPHLHGIVYMPAAGLEEVVGGHWLATAGEWGAGIRGQVVKPVTGLQGWLQYQAKHSARGVRHYQRATVPDAWASGTGRLWGTSGAWPLREELVEVSFPAYWRFRRSLRNWMIADARSRGDFRRAAWLRRLLSDPNRSRSAVRGIGEFCPESVSHALLHEALAAVDAESSVLPVVGAS